MTSLYSQHSGLGGQAKDIDSTDEWCDSGLCFSSGTDACHSGPGERLDSAIGDSLIEESDAELSKITHGIVAIEIGEKSEEYCSQPAHETEEPVVDSARVLEETVRSLAFISEDGDTALHLAVIHEHTLFLEYILNFISGDPSRTEYLNVQNDLGQTALHIAVIVKQPDTVRKLLRAGANPEIQEREGNTALHIACRESLWECVTALTWPDLHKAHLQTTNYAGFTPLHIAIQRKDINTVTMLLSAGADSNVKDLSCGRTGLHLAVEVQSAELVKLLLNQGANVNATMYSGYTPLYSALYRPSELIRTILREHGALEPEPELVWDEDESEQSDEEEEEEFDDLVINGHPVV
ncbi:NF-kappa-B inhibitor beta [Erpetoichthys calabaricus]|uniref:NF-kappa-B inhibitor beta n=1 Tax=Erpetoichthys calabaricus TaxID=27687 RepID=UPI002233F24A|nr:NF-kappa-B inhibitor beta [Erpetoichthys calabaricus]